MTDTLDPILDALVDHAYNKHHVQEDRFAEGALGPDLNIKDKLEFKAQIRKILLDTETWGFRASGNREIYYNRPMNTVIILNSTVNSETGRPFGGTVFRDRGFEGEFGRLYASEVRRLFSNGNIHQVSGVYLGGYNGLHSDIPSLLEKSLKSTPQKSSNLTQ